VGALDDVPVGHQVCTLRRGLPILVALREQLVLEVLQLALTRQLVQESVLERLWLLFVEVLQEQFVYRLEVVLFVEDPQAEVKKVVLTRLGPQVDARQRNVAELEVLEFVQKTQCRTNDDCAQAESHEADFCQTHAPVFAEECLYLVGHFWSQVWAHFVDGLLHFIFIGGRTHEHTICIQLGQVVFPVPQVLRTPLESMHQNH